jgi:hypothetical protein
MVQEMAHYGLRMTQAYKWDISNYNLWEKSEFMREHDHFQGGVPYTPVPKNTRWLVEKYYGISENLQKLVEQYFHDKNDLSPVDIPELRDFYNEDSIDYYNRYVDSYVGVKHTVPRDVK